MWLGLPLLLASALAQYPDMSSVISSSWSMWSPWSFCSNNVMVRVRACSTVRGFKCAGRNKEFQSCDSSLMHPSSAFDRMPSEATLEKSEGISPGSMDVDVVDPYVEDRRLAMRQLYDDYQVEVPQSEKARVRTRPAAPGEPRPPIVIAQYAQRFPQPPGDAGTPTTPLGSQQLRYVTKERTTAVTPSTTKVDATTSTTASTSTSTTTTFKTSLATTTTTATTTTITGSTTQNKPNLPKLTLATPKLSEDVIHDTIYASTEDGPKEIQQSEKSISNKPHYRKSVNGIQRHTYSSDEKRLSSNLVIASSAKLNTLTTMPSTSSRTIQSSLSSLRRKNTNKIQASVNVMPTSFFLISPNFVEKDSTKSLSMPQIVPNVVAESNVRQPDYDRVSIRGKQSRLRRLKLLNRRAKLRPLAVVAVGSEIDDKGTSSTTGAEVRTPHRTDRKKTYTDNQDDLEKQIDELQKRIHNTKEKLAELPTPTNPPVNEMIEDDTVRALSWMFDNVAKMMSTNSTQTVVNGLQGVERTSDQVTSEQQQFIPKHDTSIDRVIRVGEQTVEGSTSTTNEQDKWSDWSICNCGVQSRKTICLSANVSRSSRQNIGYGQRQGSACPPPEFETRPCHSDRCQL